MTNTHTARKSLTTLAAAAVLASGGAFVTAQAAGTSDVPTPRYMRVACEQEDSRGCYWDASSQGNGVGHSFYSIPVPNTMPGANHHRNSCDLIRYWDRSYGSTHDYIAC